MTIASTLFTSPPSEATGPRAGLTLRIISSKVSFATYFGMLENPCQNWKVDLKAPKAANHFVTQPSTRLPDRRHLSWKQCPALLQCFSDGLPDIGETWKLHSPAPFQWVSLCHKCGKKSQQNMHKWICSWYLLKFMFDLHSCPNDVPKSFNFCLW